MNIQVDPAWWKTLFDEIYLLTDARSVCDPQITRREVDLICQLLPIQEGHALLDLCGGHGRHSLELSRRGLLACTVLDYSKTLINIAKTTASQNNLEINFICGDARQIEVASNSYDHVIIMGNSLGYVQEEGADAKIISEAYRVLRNGGWILVDVADGDAIRFSFQTNAWHEIGDNVIVCRQREIQEPFIYAREIVMSKTDGLVRDQSYAIRIYDAAGVSGLLAEGGFRRIDIHTEFSPHAANGDYGFMNHRMIAVGQK
ncbi:MAG: class I SAM-dependent methyltransferase [Deltaproteobacteria bacterium]|jgi:D-alanine-D-alanine ligase|nr:class I SAM-dependent methyltransferase [Deltaproteobacteria bacterium]